MFLHINSVITAVWAVAFAASAAVCALVIPADSSSSPLVVVAQITGFVVPALFTRTYTERQRAAAARRSGA